MFNFDKYKEKQNQELKDKLIQKIELYDDYVFENYDKRKYKVVQKSKHKILTEFGEINYWRRKYQNRVTLEYRIFTDEHFGVIRYKNITKNLMKLLYDKVDTGRQIKDMISHVGSNVKISRASVSSIISSDKKIIVDNSVNVKKN